MRDRGRQLKRLAARLAEGGELSGDPVAWLATHEEFELVKSAWTQAVAEVTGTGYRETRTLRDEVSQAFDQVSATKRRIGRAETERLRQQEEARLRQADEQTLADLRAKGEAVLKLAGALTAGGHEPAAAGSWRGDHVTFEQRHSEWSQALTAARSLVSRSREAGQHRAAVDDAIARVSAIKQRLDQQEAQQGSQEEQARQLTAALAQREQQAQAGASAFSSYIEGLDVKIKVTGPDPAPVGVIKPEHALLLRWLFGNAILQLEGSRDRRIAALLQHLKLLRAAQRSERGGPLVVLDGEIGSYTARGQAWPNQIDLTLGIPRTDPATLLGSAEGQYQAKRDELVGELAKAFIHETAHLWQLKKYDNDSHPWLVKVSSAGMLTAGDPGIPYDRWAADVQAAYQEFEKGGLDGRAAGYAEWQRVKRAITADAYYRPGSWDRRGRELVSHLIELVYTWSLAQPFDEVFPRCSALLQRAVMQSTDL